MNTINVLKPKYRVDEVLDQIRECLESGWTGNGFKTLEFESAWKQYTRLPNACFVNSATAGLHLALHILKKTYNWKEEDEIITTPLTFVSTNHAILYETLTPVFADVDSHLCLDPNSVLAKITERTKAVIFVGVGGNAGQLDKIASICKKRNIKLILDAAHMAGTYTNGSHVGHEADVTVFSYQTVKNLPTADSGMVCFQDDSLDLLCRELAWLGINKDTYSRAQGSYKWEYDVPNVGFKYHGNSIMASMGIVGLKYLEEDNNFRRNLSSIYNQELSDIPEIRLVETSNYTEKSSKHLHQLLVPSRDLLLEYLYSHQIYPGVHYVTNLKYPMYFGECKVSEEYSKQLISLPLHLHLTDEDIKYICNKIKNFYI